MPEELGRTVEGTEIKTWEGESVSQLPRREPGAVMAEMARQADELAAKAKLIQRSCSGHDPHLGLASTEDLIEELHARMVVSRASREPWVFYRTVDDHHDDGREDSDPAREAQR